MINDLLKEGLKIVFCGTALGNKSAILKQYYAGSGNKFWRTLYEVGLTSIQLRPDEYSKLFDYGIGLTDLVKTTYGNDNQLAESDFDIPSFKKKIEKYQPKLVCFNGKNAAKKFTNGYVDYGLLNEKIGITNFYVAPSTSGAANGFWNISYWKELTKMIK